MHAMRLGGTLGALCATWLGAMSPAQAQEDITSEELVAKLKEEPAEEESEDGWNLKLKLGATFNLTDARNVVGSEEGTAVQIGVLLDASAHFRSGPHRWENRLQLQHNQSLTPPLETFVKSFDLLTLDTLYIYKLQKPEWLGLFANAVMQTAILDGFLVRANPVFVQRGGAEPVEVPAETSIDLTSAFEPLQLRESVGLYADPLREPEITVEAQAGVAAQQTITQNGFRLDSEEEDVTVDIGGVDQTVDRLLVLAPLDTVYEAGGELELRLYGTLIPEDVLKWKLSGNLFIPFVDNVEADRDLGDRLNVRVDANLALKLNEILSAEYNLTMLRQPQVTLDLQVQNTFLLALNVDII
jgi:hypothetical protein